MILYLHGFASGPGSAKAQLFKRRFAHLGLELLVPALDEGDFEHLTLDRQLRLIERLRAEAGEPCAIIGSSLGGYLAALHAARWPPAALVLLAPAFDFVSLLCAGLGEQKVRTWRQRGTIDLFHYGLSRESALDVGLLVEASRHPALPRVETPTLVLHGRDDEVVPREGVERWVAANPAARLMLFNSGHALAEVADELFEHTRGFLAEQTALSRAMPSLGEP